MPHMRLLEGTTSALNLRYVYSSYACTDLMTAIQWNCALDFQT